MFRKKSTIVKKKEEIRCGNCGQVFSGVDGKCNYCGHPVICRICHTKPISIGAKKCHICSTPY